MPKRIFKHPLSVTILVVRYRTHLRRSRCNRAVENFVDVVNEQTDDGCYPFGLDGFEGGEPRHGFVKVKRRAVKVELGDVDGAVVVAEDEVFGGAEVFVEGDVGGAVRDVKFGSEVSHGGKAGRWVRLYKVC